MKLRFLLTNDDGIHAEGLTVLETIAKALTDDVWIVAPEYEQSGASRALTQEDIDALANLDTDGWWQVPETREPVEEPLMRAAAWYFLYARNSRGFPADPVARFHLGNGARLEQMHFLAAGAEGMVLGFLDGYSAVDIEVVTELTAAAWPSDVDLAWTGGAATPAEAIADYRAAAGAKSDVERQENREKTGVFTGSYAINPVNGASIPVFIADYVLTGYGTGAIMAVPGQDARDWEFAEKFVLPIIRTVQPSEGFDGGPFLGEGPAINSAHGDLDVNGLGIAEAKAAVIGWLEKQGSGHGTTTYRLRDWLFSRQRYWGEPFPIVFDEDGSPIAVPDSMLPVELPEVPDYLPKTFEPDDVTSEPEPPLARVPDWVNVELDLGDGLKKYRRDTNTMPNWAGSVSYTHLTLPTIYSV